MIIRNGYIQGVMIAQGGIVDGFPQQSKEILTESIPCNITSSKKRSSATDTQYSSFTATILVDISTSVRWQDYQYIKVTDLHGRNLGTYEIQSIEPLDYVNTIKIIV